MMTTTSANTSESEAFSASHEENHASGQGADRPPPHAPRLSPLARAIGFALAVLAAAATIVWIVTLAVSLEASNVQTEGGAIVNTAWMAGTAACFSVTHLMLAAFPAEAPSMLAPYVWLAAGVLLNVGGFIALVSFAFFDGLAAFFSLFWLASGSLIAAKTYLQWGTPDALEVEQTARGKPRSIGGRRCCTKRRAGVGCAACLNLFVAVFAIMVVINAAQQAADLKHEPVGSIYDVEVDGRTLRMHFYCAGPPATDNSNVTFILEHGGGANSLSLYFIATELASKGYRACGYDRLGYGWTPSYVTRRDKTTGPDSGHVLVALLKAAGEPGPFHCAGHSAGTEACMRFGLAAIDSGFVVEQITQLDGYSDLVRGGAYRPGQVGALPLAPLGGYAVFGGPTGLTRLFLGVPDADFVPQDKAEANHALYSQSRFWFSQLWDLKSDYGAGEDGWFYPQLGGTKDDRGVVTYARSLPLSMNALPAWETVTPLDCSLEYFRDDYCCGQGEGTSWCEYRSTDPVLYLEQAQLFAATVGVRPGRFAVSPEGSDHGYVSEKQFAPWVAAAILAFQTNTTITY